MFCLFHLHFNIYTYLYKAFQQLELTDLDTKFQLLFYFVILNGGKGLCI